MNLTLTTGCQLLWRWHGLFCCVGATPVRSHSEAGSLLSTFSLWQTLKNSRLECLSLICCDSYSHNWFLNTKVTASRGSLVILNLSWQNDNVCVWWTSGITFSHVSSLAPWMATSVCWFVNLSISPTLWPRLTHLSSYCMDIQGPQGMNSEWGDPLAFHLVPSSGFWFMTKHLQN